MKFNALVWLACTAASVIGAATPDAEKDAAKEIKKLERKYHLSVAKTIKGRSSGCDWKKMSYRREWGSLSEASRLEYINAVQCLQQKPAKSLKADVPGARNRFDDFVATHIQSAPFIHYSGLFLAAHRHLLHLYETALRDECGYEGAQPYWDWTLDYGDLRKSSIFDGSPYSMGSNGESIPHGPTEISAFGLSFSLPPGTGGGCTHSGPFANYTVNLGPNAFEPKGPNGGLGYNPRCLKRDISLAFGDTLKPTAVLDQISSCKDFACFLAKSEADSSGHTGGHFAIGGDMVDAFSSTTDPVFWLHHAMVDRAWTIWQHQDAEIRTNQVAGTGTALNVPPSANVTLDTLIDFGILSPDQPVRDLVSTIDGPFCYMYL
ncbi:hypothetical protein FQN57_003110 [Myotisia sp. PD_48]|nr:hypothetical protein FQN57_003110 [Myotisia sp. PD_48]